jgi:hypothetical protein
MLTIIESYFVRLLRGTVVFTALVSFAIAVLALFYAGYTFQAKGDGILASDCIAIF